MFGAVEFHDACRDAGRQADPRLRGLRRARQPLRAAGPRALRGLQPPDPARDERRRLPQPGAAGLGRLPRGLLLQAAHRQGAAGAAQRGPDRPLRLPRRARSRSASSPARRARRARVVGRVRRDLRQGPLLPRDAGPRHPASSAASTRACCGIAREDRPAARRDQRLPLPAARTTTRRTTCCSASDRQEGRRRASGCASTTEQFYFKTRRGDGGGRSRTTPRRSRNTVADRRAVRLRAAGRVDTLPAFDVPPGFTHRELLREGDARRLRRAGVATLAPLGERRDACGTRSPTTRRGSTRRSTSSAAWASRATS